MYRITNFFRHIKRLFEFLPIIWKTEDWDYCYSLEIFGYALKRLRVNLEKNQRHVGYERDVRRIKVVEQLIMRMVNEEYCTKLYSEYFDKYGVCWRSTGDQFLGGCAKEDTEEKRAAFKRIMDREKHLVEHDQEYLYKLLKKYGPHWWD